MNVLRLSSNADYEIIALFDDNTEVKISTFWKFSTSLENSIRLIIINRFGMKAVQYHGKLSYNWFDPAQYQIVFNSGVITKPEMAEYLRLIGLYLHEDHSRGTDIMRAAMQICLPLIDALANNQVMTNGRY